MENSITITFWTRFYTKCEMKKQHHKGKKKKIIHNLNIQCWAKNLLEWPTSSDENVAVTTSYVFFFFFTWPLLTLFLTDIFLQKYGVFDDFIFTKPVSVKGICLSDFPKWNLQSVKQKRRELTAKCRKIFTGLKNNWERTRNWKFISPLVADGVQGKWSLKLLEGIVATRAIVDQSGWIGRAAFGLSERWAPHNPIFLPNTGKQSLEGQRWKGASASVWQRVRFWSSHFASGWSPEPGPADAPRGSSEATRSGQCAMFGALWRK